MTRIPRRTPTGPGTVDELALRIRQVARSVQQNEGSGVERFKVLLTNPLTLGDMDGSLVLEDGDPDFTIGEVFRGQMTDQVVAAGDLVWVARDGQEWHALDRVGPGTTGWGSKVSAPVSRAASFTAAVGETSLCTGTLTATLPSSPANGTLQRVVSMTGTVTVVRGGTDTITNESMTGQATLKLYPGCSASFQYLNGVWFVVDLQLRNLGAALARGVTPAINIGAGQSAQMAAGNITIVNPRGALVRVVFSFACYSPASGGQLTPYVEVNGLPANAENQTFAQGTTGFYFNVANQHMPFTATVLSIDNTGALYRVPQGSQSWAVGILCNAGSVTTGAGSNDYYDVTVTELP